VTDLIWLSQALRDLQGTHAYIALDSAIYAHVTVRRVVAAVERLKAFPESGRVAPERTLQTSAKSLWANIAWWTDASPVSLKSRRCSGGARPCAL
jgi:plasmid stabilization system protein ParE